MDQAEIVLHKIPIPIRALRNASVYEIYTDSETVLIDAGMGTESARQLISDLKDPGSVGLLAITHLHIDHVGGALELQRQLSCDIAMSEPDFVLMDRIAQDPEEYSRNYLEIAKYNGFPKSIAEALTESLPYLSETTKYSELSVQRKLNGSGNLIDGIDFNLMPGHSPGSTIYIMKDLRKLFCGDHVLPRITPNISFYGMEFDMLGLYFESLEKTRNMEVDLCYPGHGEPFRNLAKRVDQLIEHHHERISEISGIVGDWKNAFEVASEMRWNRGRKLSSMNNMERNFAFSEALAHLIHMERTDSATTKEKNGVLYFRTHD